MRPMTLAALLAGVTLARAQDMSAICSNPQAVAAAPQLQALCAGGGKMPDVNAGDLKPQGGAMGNLNPTGPGAANPLGGGGMPGGAGAPGGPGGPGAPGVPGGEGGGDGAAGPPKPASMGSGGGGPASSSRASSIQSIGGSFKGISDGSAMKEQMRQAAAKAAALKAQQEAAKAQAAADAKAALAAKKAAEEKEAALKKAAAEEEARKKAEALAAAAAAAVSTVPAVAEAAPVPAAVRTPPSQNPVLYSFELATPLLRDVDTSDPYAGLRKLYDVPLLPLRPSLPLAEGISAETPPEFKFFLVPMENDPFNFGLPKQAKGEGKEGLLEKILAMLLAALGGGGNGLRYLGFDAYVPAAGRAEPFAVGVVAQQIFWSGPASLSPLADAAKAAGAKLPPAPAVLGDASSPEEPAAAAAQVWGL